MKQRVLTACGFENIAFEERELPPVPEGGFQLQTACSVISPGTELTSIRNSGGAKRFVGYILAGTDASGRRGFVFPAAAESNGCHCDRAVFSRASLFFQLDDAISFRHAGFLRFMNIGMHPFNLIGYFPEKVCVFGLGPVGNIACQSARNLGCEVTGVDLCPQRLDIAQACGIADAVTPDAMEKRADSYDFVLDTVCMDSTFLAATKVLKNNRAASLVGQIRKGGQALAADIFRQVSRKNLVFRSGMEMLNPIFPTASGQPVSTAENLARAAQWLKAGRYCLDPLISRVVKPENTAVAQAYNDLNKDPDHHVTMVIDWQ